MLFSERLGLRMAYTGPIPLVLALSLLSHRWGRPMVMTKSSKSSCSLLQQGHVSGHWSLSCDIGGFNWSSAIRLWRLTS
jgi:hypothetical protein